MKSKSDPKRNNMGSAQKIAEPETRNWMASQVDETTSKYDLTLSLDHKINTIAGFSHPPERRNCTVYTLS